MHAKIEFRARARRLQLISYIGSAAKLIGMGSARCGDPYRIPILTTNLLGDPFQLDPVNRVTTDDLPWGWAPQTHTNLLGVPFQLDPGDPPTTDHLMWGWAPQNHTNLLGVPFQVDPGDPPTTDHLMWGVGSPKPHQSIGGPIPT